MMSVPTPKLARFWQWALMGALAFLALDTTERVLRLSALAAYRPSEASWPAVDPASSSGYAAKQHLLPLGYPDSYQWIRQTQDMLAERKWRVRHVSYDNHPDGREVHWSSSLHGWLAGLAWIDHRLTGNPLGMSVERVAPLAMPLSLALLLLVGTPWVARHFGGFAAALLGPIMVTCLPLYEDFGAEAPDHHGWVAVCGMATVLFLVAGGTGRLRPTTGSELASRRAPVLPPVRRCRDFGGRKYFILSGIAGGLGLWISAATQVPVLVGIGIGVILGTARKNPSEEDARVAPDLWRLWGLAGALTSLLFYLLEYFPSHLSLRLEVNHPLYAVAWLAAGDLLARFARWRANASPAGWRRELPYVLLSGATLSALPLCILLVPEDVFWVADRFLWSLHVDYIKEFKSIGFLAAQVPLRKLVGVVSLLPLGLASVIALLWNRGISRGWKTAVWLPLPPAILTLVLAILQARWYGTACALALAALLVGVAATTHRGTAFRWTPLRLWASGLFLALVVLPYGTTTILHCAPTFRGQPEFAPHNLYELVVRDASYWLRARVGDQPVIVASDPTFTTSLIYFGGFDGIGTLYWENLHGLRAARDFYGAASAAQAQAMAKAKGITHLVIFPWQPFAGEFARLAQGRRPPAEAPGYAFVRELLKAQEAPPWLRPIAYPTPAYEQLKPLGPVRIFEIVPEQSAAEVLLRTAQYRLALGDRPFAAQEARRAERTDFDYLPAHIFLARLAHGQGAISEFRQELVSVRRLLPQSEASLALEDRVDLLMVLLLADDDVGSARQLSLCLTQASDGQLRRLRPDALFEFGERLRAGVADRTAALRALERIDSILPPLTQEHLLFGHAVRLQRENHLREAVAMYRRQLALNPQSVPTLGNLAWILASTTDSAISDPPEALALARRAVALSAEREPFSLNALACAQAATGDFVAAVQHAKEALRLAESADLSVLASNLRTCLRLYETGSPFRDTSRAANANSTESDRRPDRQTQ